MIKIDSQSDKRLIVRGTMEGTEVNILVDTGATVGIINKKSPVSRSLRLDNRKTFQLEGAGGSFKATLINSPLVMGGKQVYQFLLADINNVVASVQRETGIRIDGIISLAQCKMMHISIDTDDNYITLE